MLKALTMVSSRKICGVDEEGAMVGWVVKDLVRFFFMEIFESERKSFDFL